MEWPICGGQLEQPCVVSGVVTVRSIEFVIIYYEGSSQAVVGGSGQVGEVFMLRSVQMADL